MKKYLLLFLSTTVFSTTVSCQKLEEVKHVLSSTSFFSKTQALIIRKDTGIDSISFPVNDKKIAVEIKKYTADGEVKEGSKSQKTTALIYSFTPLETCTYKLPNAVVWHKKKKNIIFFNDSIKLFKSNKKESDTLTKRNSQSSFFNNENRFNVVSRLDKTQKEKQLLAWTNKDIYKVSEKIQYVIESNREVADWPELKENKKLKLYSSTVFNQYNKGEYNTYYLITFMAKETGLITIPSKEIIVKGKSMQTKEIQIIVIKDD